MQYTRSVHSIQNIRLPFAWQKRTARHASIRYPTTPRPNFQPHHVIGLSLRDGLPPTRRLCYSTLSQLEGQGCLLQRQAQLALLTAREMRSSAGAQVAGVPAAKTPPARVLPNPQCPSRSCSRLSTFHGRQLRRLAPPASVSFTARERLQGLKFAGSTRRRVEGWLPASDSKARLGWSLVRPTHSG